MSILVTGGAGYIGSHVVYALVARGEDVIVADDLSTGSRASIPPNVRLEVGNVGDQQFVSSILSNSKVDAVIHFAGSIVVSESVKLPLQYYRNNTSNSRSLIETAVLARVPHFIFSSTAAVYGNPKRVPVLETDELSPISPYGKSKLMTEVMLEDVSATHELTYVALRYFNVAGADPAGRTGQSSPQATHLIKAAMQAALGNRAKLDIYGDDYSTEDGTCIRDFIHVADLAEAHLDALAFLRSGQKSTVVNCGYGRGFSVLQVIDAVKRVSGIDFATEVVGRRAGDPAALVACSDRARKLLNWKPKLQDLDLIITHAMAWERKILAETGPKSLGSG